MSLSSKRLETIAQILWFPNACFSSSGLTAQSSASDRSSLMFCCECGVPTYGQSGGGLPADTPAGHPLRNAAT